MESKAVKIGLACAGGGIEGCIYEIGVLCALDEAIEGTSSHQLDVYVGVSSGALVTACLANGISARALSRAVISRAHDPALNLTPEILFAPAVEEYARRLAILPRAMGHSIMTYLRNPWDLSLIGVLANLGSVVPVGLFDNKPLERYLARVFVGNGYTNDFRELRATLRVVAVNVDDAQVAVFGAPEASHVPISKAVQASTALPGLYPPVEIDGAYYIDGVLRKTVHASVALAEEVDLLLCINPLVPVNTYASGQHNSASSLVDHGLPPVLSQSFRTIVHSRRRAGFRSYAHLYPDADIMLIEPTPEDYERIFSNLFSYSNRHDVCGHAYQATMQYLQRHAEDLEPMLARHGLGLRHDVLEDEERTLYGNLSPRAVTRHAHDVLDETHRILDDLEYMLADQQAGQNGMASP